MKNCLLLISALGLNFFSNAQGFAWVKNSQNTGVVEPLDFAIDDSGNFYITGKYDGTVDFDPGAGVYNLTDFFGVTAQTMFIHKLDSAGNFLWAKKIGASSEYNAGNSITVDDSGNVYVTGKFTGTVDFNPGAGVFNLTSTDGDSFVLKLDTDGNFVWAVESTSGPVGNSGNSIEMDAEGNIVVVGDFSLTVDFDPGPATLNVTSSGSSDIFIQKFDPAGNLIWVEAIGGTGWDGALDVEIDTTNAIICSGEFQSTVDFDPGPGIFNLVSSGSSDVFVLKLEEAGGLTWVQKIGGINVDRNGSVEIDAAGNVYVNGRVGSSIDFDPGPALVTLPYSGSGDAFVSKYNSPGDFMWAKVVGGSGIDQGNTLVVDAAGNVFVNGKIDGVVDINPGSGVFNAGVSGDEYYFQKFNTNGLFLWGGAINVQLCTEMQVDSMGGLFISGRYFGTHDFDPAADEALADPAPGTKGFLLKLQYGAPLAPCVSPDIPVVSASVPVVCNPGASLTLTVASGNLNDAVQWQWYSGFCSGTPIGSGTSINVAPINDAFYFVRGEGGCTMPSSCAGIIIPVSDPIAASTVSTDEGSGGDGSIDLTVSGGTLPYTYSWTGPDGFNATAQDIFALGGGAYEVTITDANGCELVLNETVFSELGLAEDEQIFKIYPGQEQGFVLVEGPGSGTPFGVRIYDLRGSLVATSLIAENMQLLNLQHCAPGMYLFEASGTNGRYIQRFILY